MERDFRYLREKHGDAGAREIFEKICSQLLSAKYGDEAHNIKPSQGDEGLDIVVGDFSAPMDVFQCKYFVDGIGSSQKQQIQHSFERAIKSPNFKVKSWTLCLSCELTVKEFQWWSEWSNQMKKLHELDLSLSEGSNLIVQMKNIDIYDSVFDEDVRMQLDEIHSFLAAESQRRYGEIIVMLSEIDTTQYSDMIFVRKLENAKISEVDGCKRDFFNAELAEQAVRSQGDAQKARLLTHLKAQVYSIWETQYRQHKHDTDGNDLLTRVYQRVEDMDTTSLSTPLTQYSMFAKKGILHQWAEDCSVGWLSEYVEKLEQYLAEVEAEV